MNQQFIITLAKETAKIFLNEGIIIKTTADLPEWLKQKSYGVFIQFIDFAKNIRCQAGSLDPTTKTLGEEIIQQTIKCIKGDNIYKPIDKNELGGLKIIIYIILKKEPIFNLLTLKPNKEGVLVIKNNQDYGYVLPQKICASDLVKIACRNAKIDYQNDNFKIFRLIINKFTE